MPDYAVTVRDFSGGLNTAIDPAQLPSNMTASLSNVEILDSKAIRRRRGFVSVLSAALRAAEVKSLYRYYKTDGTKLWLALCGTGVFSTLDPTVSYPYGTVQAETLMTSPPIVTGASFSGGSAVGIAASNVTYSINVPYCTKIVLTGRGPRTFSIDGGAWVAATGTYTVSGLSPATHTVQMKLVV